MKTERKVDLFSLMFSEYVDFVNAVVTKINFYVKKRQDTKKRMLPEKALIRSVNTCQTRPKKTQLKMKAFDSRLLVSWLSLL